jgi:hypothetical protein
MTDMKPHPRKIEVHNVDPSTAGREDYGGGDR